MSAFLGFIGAVSLAAGVAAAALTLWAAVNGVTILAAVGYVVAGGVSFVVLQAIAEIHENVMGIKARLERLTDRA